MHHRRHAMLSEQPLKSSSTHPLNDGPRIRVERSNTVGVQVVRNQQGWHVNVSINKVPHTHYGPFKEPITLTEAMVYVSTLIKLEEGI
jgi:hypothetical protein